MAMGDSMLRDDSNEVTSGMDPYRYKPLKDRERMAALFVLQVWVRLDSL